MNEIKKYLIIALSSVIVLFTSNVFTAWWFHGKGKQVGIDETTAVYLKRIEEYRSGVEEANLKAIDKLEKQVTVYTSALVDRNKQVEEVSTQLRKREKELEDLINESTDVCVTAPIPDEFK